MSGAIMNRNAIIVVAIGLMVLISFVERATPAPTIQPQLNPLLCLGALGLIVFLWIRMLFQNTRPRVLNKRPSSPPFVPTYPAPPRIVPDLPPEWRVTPYPEYKDVQVMSENGNPETRRQAVMRINQGYRWFPEYMTILTTLAHDPDKRVRIAAIRALNHRRQGEQLLVEALSDEHLGVRLEAVHALGKVPSREGVHALAKVLRGPERELHAAAADSLREMHGEEVVSVLVESIGDSYTTNTRRKAARSLGEKLSPRGVAPLLAATGDPNPNVRSAAARALRMLVEHLNTRDHEQACVALAAGLGHASPIVRLHAAYNLGMLGRPEGATVLAEALTSTEPPLYLSRGQVQDALNRVGR